MSITIFSFYYRKLIFPDAQPIPAGGVLTPPAYDVDSSQFNLNEEVTKP
jgi:hypothetical protein